MIEMKGNAIMEYSSGQRKAEEEETAYAERAIQVLEELARYGASLTVKQMRTDISVYTSDHAVNASDHADVELNP